MKKLVVLFAIAFFTTICGAQIRLEKSSNEAFRLKEDSLEWQTSNVVAEPEAVQYIESFSKAIAAPDSIIFIEITGKIIKMSGPFTSLDEVTGKGIAFNSKENKIVFVEKKEKQEVKSPLFVLGALSVVFMILANLILKKKDQFRSILAFISTIFASVTFAFAVTKTISDFASNTESFATMAINSILTVYFSFPLVVLFMIFLGIIIITCGFTAFTLFNTKDYRIFRLSSVIYGIIMAAYFVFIFSGI